MSKILHIDVADKVATYRRGDGDIVCGNSDYVIEFTFDADWDDSPVKTARFVTPSGHQDVVFEGATVMVPKLYNTRLVSVGVFAGDLHTTTAAVIGCKPSILCKGGVPADPAPDVYAQIMALLNTLGVGGGGGGGGQAPKISEIFLPASGWEGDESPYSQIVAVEGATENSQIDLTPSIEQLAIFHEKDLAFVTENEDGVVTVYALGDKPMNDYTMQVTITEVIA